VWAQLGSAAAAVAVAVDWGAVAQGSETRHGLRGSKIPRSMMQIDWFFLSFRSPAWQHCQCDILFCWHDQFLLRITVGKSFVSACVKTAVDYTNLPPIHHATFAHLSRPFDRKKDCWISKEIDH
jgi:hypothetical protein